MSFPATPATTLSLAILPEPGALGFLASDGRSLGVFDRLSPSPAPGQVALPPGLRHWLAQQTGGGLRLQLPLALASRPWELAHDDRGPLDQRFTVVRQLMGSAGPAPPLQHRPIGAALLPPLQLLPQPGPGGAEAAGASPDAEAAEPDLPALRRLMFDGRIGPWPLLAVQDPALEADILCGHGPLSAEQAAALVAGLTRWPLAPRLLIWAAPAGDGGAALLQPASQAGFSLLLLCANSPAQAQAALRPFWLALAGGAGLGQAAQRMRQAARLGGHSGAAQAWLYGDGNHMPWPPMASPADGPGQAAVAPLPEDDVRQCTMLKCDLVDSTAQMARLGDEAYSERLAQYHARVARIVSDHGGWADDPQGDDGFMCYFGYPLASEQAPAQALRAGLLLAGAVADLQWQLRIGISTGRVVVRQGQPVGSAVHHAARLQALAEPGEVLVADSTQALVPQRFAFDLAHAEVALKGFDCSGAVFRLRHELAAQGTERFDARPRLTRFVGRQSELAHLRQAWQAAAAGRRQALCLSGEAGIGKSRLLREFRRNVVGSEGQVLECRCAPEHQGSALQPVIDMLRRQLGLRADDSSARSWQRLREAGLPLGQADDEQALVLLASLLSLPLPGLPALPDDGPAAQRRRTMDLLLRWLHDQAAARPICVVFEDLHWVDPSTRELAQRLVLSDLPARVLVLVTQRSAQAPAVDPVLDALPQLALTGLCAEGALALLADASGGAALDKELAMWLAERADGVPLFIEESALMAAALAQQRGPAALAQALRDAVPATLEALLTARLDQLGSARQAAQLGSAIGRQFSQALAQATNDHPDSPIRLPKLSQQLLVLERAGLASAQGEPAVWTFKHALVRDAAHQSLLQRDRSRLHGAIAAVLQQRSEFAPLVAQQPELLARHLEQAGLAQAALAGWERAARHAASRSAHAEAIAHLKHALALLATQPAAAERDRTELRLLLLLASRLIATAGYGADAVESVYLRAQALCEALADPTALVKVRLGLEGWQFMRGQFEQAAATQRLVAQAVAQQPEPLPRIQSAWALANLSFHRGEVVAAVAQMDRCLADYQQLGHRALAVQDPGVMCLCYSSWGLWEMGRADEALARARKVVDLAEGLNHQFSMGEAWGFLAAAHCFRGEIQPGLAAARRAIEVCEAGGFSVWLAHAMLMHGRLLAEVDTDAGIEQMRQGDAMWAATGAVVTRPFYLALRAEGLALADRVAQALVLLEQARALVARHGERYWEPELQRLTGELLLRAPGRADPVAAEGWLVAGLAGARAAQLHGLALRSATALGRLWASQQRPAEAVAVVQQALDRLTEGYATADQRQARGLVALWRAGGDRR